jgi:hypothetical protein
LFGNPFANVLGEPPKIGTRVQELHFSLCRHPRGLLIVELRLISRLRNFGSGRTAKPGIKAIDNALTQSGKPPDVVTDQTNRFAEASIVRMLRKFRIDHAEIVANDVPLLDVEFKLREFIRIESIKRIDLEVREPSLGELDILEVVLDRFYGRGLGPGLGNAIEIDSLEHGLERRQHILMSIAEKPIGKLLPVLALGFRQVDLHANQIRFTGEVKPQIWCATVGAEQGDRVYAIVTTAVIAKQFTQQVAPSKAGFWV